MKGAEIELYRFLEGSGKRFVIPVYQRNYDWEIEHCKQLYDDLIYTIKNDKKRHFFGSVVSVYNSEGQNLEFLIIDGQQRITTVSLLLLAMHNLLDKGIIVSENTILKQKIHDEFLVDKYQPEETRIKLKPVKDDKSAFNSLFGDEEDYIKTSKVVSNYSYFCDRILKHEISIDKLYDAICKLEVIDIKLTPPDDDPQLIFESLNSTGLELSEGDKIRNYILMGLPSSKQEKLYNSYWNKIEELTDYDVSSFIRHYLTIKQGKIPNLKKVHSSFKEYVESNPDDIEEILANMLRYARHYHKLIAACTGIKALDNCLFRLERLETSITYPFFLEVFEAYENETIDQGNLSEVFTIIESYLFRRIICDLPTNSLNKVFTTLHKDTMKHTVHTSYVEALKYVLLSKQGKPRFPDDTLFENALTVKDIYNMTSKNKWYIFERLENKDNLERIEVYKMLDNGELTIEHIMPQTLNDDWKEDLGSNYLAIHQEWLHRLANITLTAYNSNYKNFTFVNKRDMKKGYRESGLRLNQELCSFEKWTVDEMTSRQNTLISFSMQIWPTIKTCYQPVEEANETYTLDDEIDCTGKKVTEFMLLDQSHKVSSWTEFYKKVLLILHDRDETVLNKLALKQMNCDLTSHVDTTDANFRACIQIDDNIFIWTNTNTQNKLRSLEKFFKLYGVETSELLYVVENAPAENGEVERSRYDIRLRFWEGLLQEFNEKSKLFSNVNPSKDNWLNAGAGISSGVQYNFTIGKRFCAVQLELYSSNKERNKWFFDKLIAKKALIEEKLGENLIWERNDNKLHSKIRIVNNETNIYNEENWTEIRSFLVNSMLRFYDVIHPTLFEISKDIPM